MNCKKKEKKKGNVSQRWKIFAAVTSTEKPAGITAGKTFALAFLIVAAESTVTHKGLWIFFLFFLLLCPALKPHHPFLIKQAL